MPKRKEISFEQSRQRHNDQRRESRKKTRVLDIEANDLLSPVKEPDILPGERQVVLQRSTMPDALTDLYKGMSDEAKHFRQYVRTYNNMFAFTSLGVRYDQELTKRTDGIYTFRVQGQMYHFMNYLTPNNDGTPKNIQLYFYDTENEICNRQMNHLNFKEDTVKKLMDIMQVNPYAVFCKNLISLKDMSSYKITLYANPTTNERVFNNPTVSQVAGIWLESSEYNNDSSPHIQIYPCIGKPQIIKHYYGCYDPLQYPLLFPYGQPGWSRHIKKHKVQGKTHEPPQTPNNALDFEAFNNMLTDATPDVEPESTSNRGRGSRNVSCREYYCYKLQIRDDDNSNLLHAGRLLQQYVIDMYIKIETSRLDYYKSEEMQTRLRKDAYQGLVDGMSQGCRTGADVGKRVILPSSFIGGPRDMRKRYMDALTLVQRYGKPDIFLTITTNPSWPEIKSMCLPTDEIHNRPDIVSRIFRAKLEVLKNELLKRKIFGNVRAYTYVVEFQKRGLPHAHFLLILSSSAKMFDPNAFDRIVCAELPNERENHYLFQLVTKHMLHGPCGSTNPECPCTKKTKKCKFGYPKSFSDVTKYGDDAYPIYRRRDNGSFVNVRGGRLDNRWVIPYNPYLLTKFNCHINVEICSTIQAVKYIYKYIYKGHDRISYTVSTVDNEPTIDEIANFQQGRWISAPEAMWRIYGFDLNQMQPPVISLPIHLENEQLVSFTTDESLSSIVGNPKLRKTMLTQYFEMNAHDRYAKQLNCMYTEFPEHFTWHRNVNEWRPRKNRDVIGRMLTCYPSEGEKFYLRLLLTHVRGATSFNHIKTVRGVLHTTFQEAAHALGLTQSDNTSEQCIEESIAFLMPSALRQLFATVLIYCSPENPNNLWLKYQKNLSEDFLLDKSLSATMVKQKTLDSIVCHLYSMGKRIEDFPFISDIDDFSSKNSLTRELQTEQNIVVTDEDISSVGSLNSDQKVVYDKIMSHVNANNPCVFFVDGPGGTGKTFLYRAILATIRSTKRIALATATSGVAASLLPGGRTAHSRFKIPLGDEDNKSCNISKQSTLAYLIRLASIIIWDEVTMAKRSTIEKFDEILRDVMDTSIVFGGKVIVFGGDFRQTLPVIPGGSRENVINSSIVMSPLWKNITKVSLHKNMRASLDIQFSSYLLRVGNGVEPMDCDGHIKIPSTAVIPFEDDETSLNKLIDAVFPDISNINNILFPVGRAILTTRNEFVHEINDILIHKCPGDEIVYLSADESIGIGHAPDQEELFNSMDPNGLPPHKLTLKKNAPIILLRNLNPSEGLCNGTRLTCKDFNNNVIYAEISFGSFFGKAVFIPRITLESPQTNFCTVPFKRKQFPVRLCYAMTINKSQGQTLDYVGIYLKEPVFSHGQLYVALSRAKSINDLKILIRPSLQHLKASDRTKNVVYQEVLEKGGIEN